MKEDDIQTKARWQILRSACSKRVPYFNVANLHYKWTGGEQTDDARRLWYTPLRQACTAGIIAAYTDLFTQTPHDPNLFEVSYVEASRIDFRRRMHFRATRKGWALFHKQNKGNKANN